MTHTIYTALDEWLAAVRASRSKNTSKTYAVVARKFKETIGKDQPASALTEKHYDKYLQTLKNMSAASEKQNATILSLFFEFCAAKGIRRVNMDAIRYTRRNDTRRVGKRLRRVDMDALREIDRAIVSLKPRDVVTARAKAFVLLLIRSGLRASEAAGLRMSDLNMEKHNGRVIGKGNKEAVFMFDADVASAILFYHRFRKTNSPIVFMSHSRRHGKEPRPLDNQGTDTPRRDVERILKILLSDAPKYKITPHIFRHYFITMVYRSTRDFKATQQAARHTSMNTTLSYTHDEEEDLIVTAEKMGSARLVK